MDIATSPLPAAKPGALAFPPGETWSPTDLFLWGVQLMAGSARSNAPRRRQVQMRDGLIFATEALRGLRLRDFLAMKLGEGLRRKTDGWRLDALDDGDTHVAAHLPRILAPWLDRYVQVERQELLGRRMTNALWVTWNGEQIGEIAFDRRLRWWSSRQFGMADAFGSYDFRAWIGAGPPALQPQHPQLAALLMRISLGLFEGGYDPARDLASLRAVGRASPLPAQAASG